MAAQEKADRIARDPASRLMASWNKHENQRINRLSQLYGKLARTAAMPLITNCTE
jgi:hypothetical protein